MDAKPASHDPVPDVKAYVSDINVRATIASIDSLGCIIVISISGIGYVDVSTEI
jgi:hypothetical protein